MSILSKICVVLLLVLTLVACTVFSKMALVGPKYKQALDVKKQDAASLRNKLNNAKADVTKLNADLATAQNTNLQAKRQYEVLKSQFELFKTKAATEKGKLQGNLRQLSASYAKLEENYKANTRERDSLNKEKQRAQLMLEQTDEALRTLRGQFDEVTTQKERLERLAKSRHQQIAELQAENEELKAKLRTGGVSAQPETVAVPVAPSADFTGTITAVRANGLVSVNVGRVKGVTKGMVLKVYRGKHFVANLRIEEVWPNEAAGIIFDKQRDVLQGDKATTSLR